MLVGQRKELQKCFDLSTFNYNLNESNASSNLGVMNFQKWERFLAHPVFTNFHFYMPSGSIKESNQL